MVMGSRPLRRRNVRCAITIEQDNHTQGTTTNMKSEQTDAVQALRRARAWLDERKTQMDAITSLAPLVVRLEDAIAKLTVSIGEQERLRVAGLERTKKSD